MEKALGREAGQGDAGKPWCGGRGAVARRRDQGRDRGHGCVPDQRRLRPGGQRDERDARRRHRGSGYRGASRGPRRRFRQVPAPQRTRRPTVEPDVGLGRGHGEQGYDGGEDAGERPGEGPGAGPGGALVSG